MKRLAGFENRIGAEIDLQLGGPLSQPVLDDALFALDAITDFRAAVVLGDPVELTIEGATPASLRVPDGLDDVRVAQSRDPTQAPALANGHLHL
ncbi:hypothetical protein J8J27_24065, partial [Mycobacterium tuberculosis]|nr:hypothetical protein [Mycobacterium tuberculosis]